MVQEYQDAPSLASKTSFTPLEIKQIIVSVLEILVDLQQRIPPIIHRDLKPENILVDRDNRAYLIDFGLARVGDLELATSSIIAGTPGFIAPEELFNRPLTKASDLYSVGATAIALITHTPSSSLSNPIDDNYQFQFSHLLVGINPDFIAWLHKMVAPQLKDRFPDAETALNELKSIDIIGTSNSQSLEKNNMAIASMLIVIGTLLTTIGLPQLFTTKSVTKSSVVELSSSPSTLSPEQRWFRSIKPRCNAVEVVTAMGNTTYPQTAKGAGYAASCYALAGRLDLADRVIRELPRNARGRAIEVVFNIGHPVADAGDDKSAGAIMDLVIKYWPENYMALYHAGMSAYVLSDYSKAQAYLQEFLRIYQAQDGWTNQAKNALSRMERDIPADESFLVHH